MLFHLRGRTECAGLCTVDTEHPAWPCHSVLPQSPRQCHVVLPAITGQNINRMDQGPRQCMADFMMFRRVLCSGLSMFSVPTPYKPQRLTPINPKP